MSFQVLVLETDFRDPVLGNFWRWHVLSGDRPEKDLTSSGPLFSHPCGMLCMEPLLLNLFPQKASTIRSPMFGFNNGLQASFSTSHSPTSANAHILFFWFICFKKSLCIFKVMACYLVSKTCPQLRADFRPVSYSNLGKVGEILFAPVSITFSKSFNLPTST